LAISFFVHFPTSVFSAHAIDIRKRFGKFILLLFFYYISRLNCNTDFLHSFQLTGSKEIATYEQRFYAAGDRKITLNFALIMSEQHSKSNA
jgi:hypothetical protein